MAKNNGNKAQAQASLDWNAEAAKAQAAAKEKAGSRGDQLAKVGGLLTADTPAAATLRGALGEAGAQVLIDCPRNVLAKLPKLAACIAAGTSWCTAAGMSEAGRRKEDASVVVALAGLGAGTERQKAVVASAMHRYPGGANAQMPAALDALCLFGIVARKDNAGARNAEYVLADEARAAKLMPTG